MNLNNQYVGPTSTPKRRRLGNSKITRTGNYSPLQKRVLTAAKAEQPSERCDSPPIPCNQIEYLSDSNNSGSYTSGILGSPIIVDSSLELSNGNIPHIENNISISKASNRSNSQSDIEIIQNEIDNLENDMFESKLEIEESAVNVELEQSMCEKELRKNVEESFNCVNHSICGLEQSEHDTTDINNLFQTKDDFYINDKESNVVFGEKGIKNVHQIKQNNVEKYYGLPIAAKGLFKSLRNIEKFYDWQEECLNLPAIAERQNLIYLLPTSGGKTLVAEVLMMREVINRKHNALLILPFVAIVQEKVWSLSPFAVQLDFLVEEYASGKGHLPPKKRRNKNSIYVATIEKGLALVRSLIELKRLHEIGLIVVDELHLIGEEGRGSTLETLLSTVIFADQGIQVVGMSATLGGAGAVAGWLRARLFRSEFRPVALAHYVKRGDRLWRMEWRDGEVQLEFDREVRYDYSAAARALDPDWLGALAAERAPSLVFCATRRSAESVAALLARMQRREVVSARAAERAALAAALAAEGAAAELRRAVRCGVAYHHAGLSADERALLETAYRSGTLVSLACTSTLAAGVNLPAARVVVRAAARGRAALSLAEYRQAAGRAGRAGLAEQGTSTCRRRAWWCARCVPVGYSDAGSGRQSAGEWRR